MTKQQMSEDRFIYYTDYFSYALIAGAETGPPLADAALIGLRVNPNSFEVYEDAITSRNSLVNNFQSSYESVFTEAFALQYMTRAFSDLANHIREWTGSNVDEYLTQNGIKVHPSYASVMNILNDPISDDNVEAFT